ncbi:MAG: TonB C-terminal domain-containing protein [Rhodospirillaceae bacterium]|nr:TonB C-terminal domain-containing protein [Rhodospirillales bacterium]
MSCRFFAIAAIMGLMGFSACAAQPVSMAEMDRLRAHVTRFWVPPDGLTETIDVRVKLAPDGKVLSAVVDDEATRAQDELYGAAARAARQAVRSASPLPIPPEKASQFEKLVLSFAPRNIQGRR